MYHTWYVHSQRFAHYSLLLALAKHYNLSRMTLYRWQRLPDVLRRANWLAKCNKDSATVEARPNWESVIRAQIKKARAGDTQAAKFLDEIAWHQDEMSDKSPEDATIKVVYVDRKEDQ
jgi:hypothetical protein